MLQQLRIDCRLGTAGTCVADVPCKDELACKIVAAADEIIWIGRMAMRTDPSIDMSVSLESTTASTRSLIPVGVATATSAATNCLTRRTA
ncbi:MAG: hypothetical protein ABIW82_01610 [Dokdonella sp.]